MGMAVLTRIIGVKNCRNAAEHLQDKRISVHQIELFDRVLYRGCH